MQEYFPGKEDGENEFGMTGIGQAQLTDNAHKVDM